MSNMLLIESMNTDPLTLQINHHQPLNLHKICNTQQLKLVGL